MSQPSLVLKCGCEVLFVDGEMPQCAEHGVQSVSRVVRMPRPRFKGVATGPCVTTTDLPPYVGPLKRS